MTIVPFERRARHAETPPPGDVLGDRNPFTEIEKLGKRDCAVRLPLTEPIEALADALGLVAAAGWITTSIDVSEDGQGLVLGVAVAVAVLDGGKKAPTHRQQDKPSNGAGLVPLPSVPASAGPMSHFEEPIA